MSEILDKTLVNLTRQGDQEAFAELVTRYSGRLFGACFGLLGQAQDAEDCVQEAWIKIFRNLAAFRGGSSFYTWAYRIAVNCCYDAVRKRSRTQAMSLDQSMETENGSMPHQLADQASGPDDLAEQAELVLSIRQEIAGLKPILRDMIVMRDLQGFSYTEIADLTGLKTGTVKSRLSRARSHLAKRLEKREQDRDYRRLTNKKNDL